ncbi:hypothetical protein THASP1DRAFT_33020 [Thamnocephalis sphaerospora]|uniref:Uncharacterized protein n=1 Tax=Thamnocephalis sphaerospora TaxID=78915 RepID=A0A4P9XIF8_9FUNG|nr:hypothetical protein THASP1DRAFT_33020 [Thamnocephalis sphaerospora]|eukprot:RKP05141.1 hypothetical protein THASP1DRAFT_33020 [Thamnocephalis sphaerospora]
MTRSADEADSTLNRRALSRDPASSQLGVPSRATPAVAAAAASRISPADSAESSDTEDEQRLAEAHAILACTASTSANDPPTPADSNSASTTDNDDDKRDIIADSDDEDDGASVESRDSFDSRATMASTKKVTRRQDTQTAAQLQLPEPHAASILSYVVRPFTTVLAASATVLFWRPLSVVNLIGPERMRLLTRRRLPPAASDDPTSEERTASSSLFEGFKDTYRRVAHVALTGKGSEDESDGWLDHDSGAFEARRRRITETLHRVERRINALEQRRERLLERLDRLDDQEAESEMAGNGEVASDPPATSSRDIGNHEMRSGRHGSASSASSEETRSRTKTKSAKPSTVDADA